MAETKTNTSRDRTNFSKIRTAIQIPNLIEVQKNSYERFLQMNMLPEEREDTGLQAVFNSVFPISDFRGVSRSEEHTSELQSRVDLVCRLLLEKKKKKKKQANNLDCHQFEIF